MADPTANPPESGHQNTATDPPKPPENKSDAVDVAAIEQAATAKAHAQFLQQFKETTGFDNPEAFKEAELKKQGKLQEFADSKSQEAQSFKAKYEQTLIGNEILSAASDAVDPTDVVAALSGKGVVDDYGHVTIDGKPVADAVKAILEAKPHWAKAAGGTGSGAPANTPGSHADKTAQDYQTAAKNKDIQAMLKLNTGAKS